jgi:aldehyde dehydrogenase (NAD+)
MTSLTRFSNIVGGAAQPVAATSDIGRALRGSAALEAGTVWVNSYRAVSYMAPFGGYKRSGIGRESGQQAIDAYLQTKTVWIDTIGKTANPFIIR